MPRNVLPTTLAAVAASAMLLATPLFGQDGMGGAAPAEESAPAQPAGDAQATPPAGNGLTDAATVAQMLAPEPPSKSDLSYALGYFLGNGYSRAEVEIDPQEFSTAMQAGLTGGEPRLPEERMQQILMSFENQLRQQQQTRMAAMAAEQSQKGQEFLAANATKEGVKTTPSGLQYQVLQEGNGDSPKPTDTVRVHYRGTFIDGTQFDSSYDRGEPAEFPVNRVIAGWTEAMQLMKPGAKYRLVIPSDLAYGPEGSPPVIPPSSVLVFDVELLDVLPAPAE